MPGLVHLAEDQCGLLDDARLGHLLDEVPALTGALTDAGEHGHTVVVVRHAVDHLLDEDRLADARAAEQADLSTLHVRGEEVDRLDAGLEHLGLGLQLIEVRRLAVDGPALGDLEGLALGEVQRVAHGVEDGAEGDVADGHRDRSAGIGHVLTADQAVGRLERDRADHAVAEVLGGLEGDDGRIEPGAARLDARVQSVVHGGDVPGGNSMSTTAPVTRAMRPVAVAGAEAVVVMFVLSKGGRARAQERRPRVLSVRCARIRRGRRRRRRSP